MSEAPVYHRFAVTPGVGQVFFTPEQLAAIGQAVGPEGRVELNAFMQLILHSIAPNAGAEMERLRAAGLEVYPVGPVIKNLHTCTFCMGERIDGLEDARRLDEAVAGQPVPFPTRVGFSGCAANCGEALAREIGVVRMDGGRYDLFVGGRPGGLTPQFGQRVAEALTPEELIPAVEALLACYRESAKGKERLWKNVYRLGIAHYQEAIARRLAGTGQR